MHDRETSPKVGCDPHYSASAGSETIISFLCDVYCRLLCHSWHISALFFPGLCRQILTIAAQVVATKMDLIKR
jgi:hypothetical protein